MLLKRTEQVELFWAKVLFLRSFLKITGNNPIG